jgi:TolB-like protein
VTQLIERLGAALADRYDVERELGAGAMATVFLARDPRHNRSVAIKVLKPELAAAIGHDRFLREIEISAQLRHPHILPLYDSGEAGGFLYYVMPFIEGESLRDRLDRDGQLSVDDSLRIAREVADALGYAHSRGVVHRDIKPANIMLDSGHAVVADFGIARAVDAAGGDRLTHTGVAVGTPAYMSPEQASGTEVADARSDLYSLACVVYETLAGEPPFTGPTASVVMARHTLDPVPPLTTARSSTPPHVARAVHKALEKTPADRFTSVSDWAKALAAPAPEEDLDSRGAPAAPTILAESRPGRPDLAVAVLPIRASSAQAEVAALAEGLTEDITTGLARFSYLSVVGGQGREQLTDAATGAHLWAETYDSDLDASSVFDVQDRLTDRIVASVADQHGALIRHMSESVRNKPIGQMEALDAVFLTFDYWQVITPEAHLRAREALERAVEDEPGSADAWACLSQMYCEEYKHDYNVLPDSLGRALTTARRAVDLDRTCQQGYYALAQALFFRDDFGGFRSAAERAVQLNRRDGNTVAFMGILLGYAGDTETGTSLIRQVLELNPHHPGWYLFGIFYDHFVKEEYEEALDVAQAINLPGYYPTHVSIAAAAGHLGRLDVAKSASAELLAVYPEFAERGRAEYGKWVRDEAVLDSLLEGLRLAGMEVADA